jgi:hypothetical protein
MSLARIDGFLAWADSVTETLTLRKYLSTSNPTEPTYVAKVRGARDAQDLITSMANRGYTLENMASRKQAYSLLTGVFTGRQVHTLVFRKR